MSQGRRAATIVALAALLCLSGPSATASPPPSGTVAWNAVVATSHGGEVTIFDRSGTTVDVDRLDFASDETQYETVLALGSRVVVSDMTGFGPISVFDAATSFTEYYPGFGEARSIPDSVNLIVADSETGRSDLIVDIVAMEGTRLGENSGVPLTADDIRASPDGSIVALTDWGADRSWVVTVKDRRAAEVAGRIVAITDHGLVTVRRDGESEVVTVESSGQSSLVPVPEGARVAAFNDGTVIVAEATGRIWMTDSSGVTRDVGSVAVVDGVGEGIDVFVANGNTRFIVTTGSDVHTFDPAGRRVATVHASSWLTGGFDYENIRRCVPLGGDKDIVLDTTTGDAFEILHGYGPEVSADGCVFETQSLLTPAFYRDGTRYEFEGQVDIRAISPDGTTGILYSPVDGWFVLADLRDLSAPFVRLLPSTDLDHSFAFVTI